MSLNCQTAGTAQMFTAVGKAQTAHNNIVITMMKEYQKEIQEAPLLLEAEKQGYYEQGALIKEADYDQGYFDIASGAAIGLSVGAGKLAASGENGKAAELENQAPAAEEAELRTAPAGSRTSSLPVGNDTGTGTTTGAGRNTDGTHVADMPSTLSDKEIVSGSGINNRASRTQAADDANERTSEDNVTERKTARERREEARDKRAAERDRQQRIRFHRENAMHKENFYGPNGPVGSATLRALDAGKNFTIAGPQQKEKEAEGDTAAVAGSVSIVDRIVSQTSAYQQAMEQAEGHDGQQFATLAQLGATRN